MRDRSPTPSSAREALGRWLAGDGPWVTVTGLPGVGRRRLVADVVGAAPGVRIVYDGVPAEAGPSAPRTVAISTRRGLHPAEHVVEVQPPTAADAERLFADAVRRAHDQPELDARAITRIVDAVGGHPLALELLARRASLLPLDVLCVRLDAPPGAGLDPLMHADHPPFDGLRRRLAALIEGLDAAHRAALKRCRVFAGPFGVDDAERVTGAGLDALQSLRDHNLVAREGAELIVPPIVRRFVRAHLDAPEPEVGERHRALYLDRIRAAIVDTTASRPDGAARLRRLRPELLGLVEHPTTTSAAALALALLAEERGNAEAQRSWSERAAHTAEGAPERVMSHVFASRTARQAGDLEQAGRWLAGVEAEADGADLRARWTEEAGSLANARGDFDVAAERVAETLGHVRELGDAHREARALINLGVTRFWRGETDAAITAYAAAGDIAERLGAHRLLSISASNLCLAELWLERSAPAREAGHRALQAFRALGDPRGEGTTLNHLSMVAINAGRLDDADRLAREAAEVLHRCAFRQQETYAISNRSEVAFERGDMAAHRALLDRLEAMNTGDALARVGGPAAIGDPRLTLHLARCRARAAMRRGDVTAARSQIERAHDLRRAAAAEATDLHLERARIALADGDRAAAERAWADAQAHTRVEAVGHRVAAVRLLFGDVPASEVAAMLVRLARTPSLAARRVARWVWPTVDHDARREVRARLCPARLVVHDTARAVRLPSGVWVELGRRDLWWRLVETLARAPGALPADALIEALWPGERIKPSAASNRLYNAVALVRKAGLADIIERRTGGYTIEGPVGWLTDDVIDAPPPCVDEAFARPIG